MPDEMPDEMSDLPATPKPIPTVYLKASPKLLATAHWGRVREGIENGTIATVRAILEMALLTQLQTLIREKTAEQKLLKNWVASLDFQIGALSAMEDEAWQRRLNDANVNAGIRRSEFDANQQRLATTYDRILTAAQAWPGVDIADAVASFSAPKCKQYVLDKLEEFKRLALPRVRDDEWSSTDDWKLHKAQALAVRRQQLDESLAKLSQLTSMLDELRLQLQSVEESLQSIT